jgi:hypothetical protein
MQDANKLRCSQDVSLLALALELRSNGICMRCPAAGLVAGGVGPGSLFREDRGRSSRSTIWVFCEPFGEVDKEKTAPEGS